MRTQKLNSQKLWYHSHTKQKPRPRQFNTSFSHNHLGHCCSQVIPGRYSQFVPPSYYHVGHSGNTFIIRSYSTNTPHTLMVSLLWPEFQLKHFLYFQAITLSIWFLRRSGFRYRKPKEEAKRLHTDLLPFWLPVVVPRTGIKLYEFPRLFTTLGCYVFCKWPLFCKHPQKGCRLVHIGGPRTYNPYWLPGPP